MPKGRFTIVAVLILGLGGCAGLGPDSGATTCVPVSTTLTAQDANSGNRPTFIRINPDTITVEEGCEFVINNPRRLEVSTDGGGTGWLDSGPSSNRTIRLGPASKTGGQTTFKYTITVTGIGQLDPRARVM